MDILDDRKDQHRALGLMIQRSLPEKKPRAQATDAPRALALQRSLKRLLSWPWESRKALSLSTSKSYSLVSVRWMALTWGGQVRHEADGRCPAMELKDVPGR